MLIDNTCEESNKSPNSFCNPLVSIIIPVFNCEKFIAQSIESVLSQTYKHIEVIIVNDGSTDSSIQICQNYSDERITIINQKNSGIAKALNSGLKTAKGKYIARMDADDICFLDRLDNQVTYMEKHPNISVLSGTMISDTFLSSKDLSRYHLFDHIGVCVRFDFLNLLIVFLLCLMKSKK